MSGLSGAGKSTLANHLSSEMNRSGIPTVVLDGDTLRATISKDLGYSLADRLVQNERVAYIAKLLNDQNINVITALISPTERIRGLAKEIIGTPNFHLVWIDCPLEVCEKRDVKGLYRKSKEEKIKGFTGKDQVYEPPLNPWLHVKTDIDPVKVCCQKIIHEIMVRTSNQLK